MVADEDGGPLQAVDRGVAQLARVPAPGPRRGHAHVGGAERRLAHQHVAQQHPAVALCVGRGVAAAVAGGPREVDAQAVGGAVRAGVAAVEALAEDLGDAVRGGAVEEMLLVRLNLYEHAATEYQRSESVHHTHRNAIFQSRGS